MYAIVKIQGQQFKVEKDQEIYVNRISGNEGDELEFGEVLLVNNDGDLNVGAPHVDGAKVKATVLTHLKGDKIIVFHKKRRKGFRKKNGHRQALSRIRIDAINA